jgi:hypothetical protein
MKIVIIYPYKAKLAGKVEDSKDFPKVEPIPDRMDRNWGKDTLVILASLEVDPLMCKVPHGKLIGHRYPCCMASQDYQMPLCR